MYIVVVVIIIIVIIAITIVVVSINMKRLRLGTILGATWRRLGLLGGVLEPSWGRLVASWGRMMVYEGVLEASWRRLGSVLEVLGDEDREMARKSQLKAQKYPFYLDSVTSTLKKHRKTRRGSDKK